MQKPPAVQNKIVQKLQEDLRRKFHQEKLKRARSTVDQRCPSSFRQAKFNLKGNQMEIEKFQKIERENKILSDKMQSLHRKRSWNSLSSRHQNSQKERRRRRQKELVELTIQNYALLKRLENKKPFCTVEKWQQDRRKTENILKNISEFPKRQSSRPRLNSSMSSKYLDQSELMTQRNKTKLEPLKIPVNPNVKTVIEQYHFINNQQFFIEIQTDNQQILYRKVWIIAVDSKPERFTLEFDYQEAIQVMGGRENFRSLLRMLQMENGELVLCAPIDKK